ncbi:MAG: sensor histidine kinase [Terriglobia bacterium]
MAERPRTRVLHFILAVGIVLAITVVFKKSAHVNATTIALAYLLAILIVSTVWGLAVAVVMSVAAVLTFNFYFLPPVGAFTIADPENWVALVAFLAVSVIVSHLSSRARQRAEDALARRREIERLYRFSQQLLVAGNVIELLNRIPSQIVDVFEMGAAALFLADKQKIYRSGPGTSQLEVERLQAVAARDEPIIDAANSLCLMPVRLGVRTIGSLGISGPTLSRQTLEALGNLVAIAMERARAVEQLGQTAAAREGERLRTALLDAVTHELRTPLTSIKASVTSLLSNSELSADQRQELLSIINEESDRLNRLVGEAAEMSRLDAGEIELKLEPHSIDELIGNALEQCKSALGSREIRVEAPPGLPRVQIDLPRANEVLVHLLENASRYSPQDQPITVSAEANGDFVVTSVADRGAGISDLEQSLIFEKFYRGKDHRYLVQGTGMGLPIAKAIVEAHGGSLSVTTQLGHGSVFSFSLLIEHGRMGAQ